jgi:hypothetical protein
LRWMLPGANLESFWWCQRVELMLASGGSQGCDVGDVACTLR